MTILSDYGMHPVVASDVSKGFSKETKKATLEPITSKRIVGIEVEVENNALNTTPSTRCWVAVEDGSLRNHGGEWITLPIEAVDAPAALHELLRVCLSNACSFGPRTSVHVHVNAQDLTVNQVKQLVLLYCVFEQPIYEFVGKNRNKNIYCVPVCDTNVLREFKTKNFNSALDRWSKYIGLNLLPITSKGTIEFRHMHGCSDPDKLSRWVRILLRLFDFVSDAKLNTKKLDNLLCHMDSSFNYNELFNQIFKEDAILLKFTGWSQIKQSVFSMKQAYVKNELLTEIISARSGEAPFYQFTKRNG